MSWEKRSLDLSSYSQSTDDDGDRLIYIHFNARRTCRLARNVFVEEEIRRGPWHDVRFRRGPVLHVVTRPCCGGHWIGQPTNTKTTVDVTGTVVKFTSHSRGNKLLTENQPPSTTIQHHLDRQVDRGNLKELSEEEMYTTYSSMLSLSSTTSSSSYPLANYAKMRKSHKFVWKLNIVCNRLRD